MLSFIWNLTAFIIALGTLIIVHEFGHFWVARRCGIKVERFSVGFGKSLWSRFDRHGTEYTIALVPLGGYVKMLDERVDNVVPELRHQAFNNKTILQRAMVIVAGPIANFLFAIFAYWLVFIQGIPSIRPEIGEIINGSVAAEAQILPGMELKAVDSIKTPDWDAVRMALISKIGNSDVILTLSPFNSSQNVKKRLDLRQWNFEPGKHDPISALGIIPLGMKIETVLANVQANSPASIAGLQVGDKIVKVNDQPLITWWNFVNLVRKNPDRAIVLDVERNGKIINITLIPSANGTEGFAGVLPRMLPLSENYKIIRQYSPIVAIGEAGSKTWQLIKITVNLLGKLITGDVKLNNLSGPISIAQGAGMSAESGIIYYLMFLALISINIGIINLFPLPVLDGGHLFFLMIEKIKGKPVSERVQDFSYHIGSILLVLLMGLALFNDFSRL